VSLLTCFKYHVRSVGKLAKSSSWHWWCSQSAQTSSQTVWWLWPDNTAKTLLLCEILLNQYRLVNTWYSYSWHCSNINFTALHVNVDILWSHLGSKKLCNWCCGNCNFAVIHRYIATKYFNKCTPYQSACPNFLSLNIYNCFGLLVWKIWHLL